MADKKRAFGRSLLDFPDLNGAEKELLAKTKNGEPAEFGTRIPETDEEKRKCTIRAGLVRFLALGGDDITPVHERGVWLRGAVIEGGLNLNGCTLAGDLSLLNCDLTSTLTMYGACARSINLGGSQCLDIRADRMIVSGGVFLRDGFVSRGVVRLLGADIAGNLDLADSRLEEMEDGTAIHCDGVQVGGSMSLNRATITKGAVRFVGAKITGGFACRGSQIEGKNSEGNSLVCDGIHVGGALFLDRGFVAHGAVRLLGSSVSGNLVCRGGQFLGQDADGDSLIFDRIKIIGSLYLTDDFVAYGAVRLVSATVDGDIGCLQGHFGAAALPSKETNVQASQVLSTKKSENRNTRAINLARATVGGTLWLGGLRKPKFDGGVDLTGAKVSRLVDSISDKHEDQHPGHSLSNDNYNPTFLRIDGLTYDRFGESTNLDARARLAFLRLQEDDDLGKDFKPQPWMQIVKVLRESGHTEAARDVAIEFEEQRRRAGKVPGLAVSLHYIYGILVGYGHRPMKLVGIMLFVWAISAILYQGAAEDGWFAPTDPHYFQEHKYDKCRPENGGNWITCAVTAPEYSTFNSLAYSLDVILPLVDLQQEKVWAPIVAKGPAKSGDPLVPINGGVLARLLMWFEVLFGWLSSALLAAVLTGLAKRVD